jgi:enamine deaminase RidA (YjgF/YER057c/UK114 family)
MANLPNIVEPRGRHCTRPYPADAIVEVSSPALADLEIEIKAVAATEDAAERV